MRRWILGLVAVALAVGVATCAHVGDYPGREAVQAGALTHGGRERTWLYAGPKGPGPHPLVVALAGRFGTPEGTAKLTGLVPLALREGFVVVFPLGVDRSWNDSRGHGPAAEQGVDDVGFLSALIDELVARHGVDPARVYVTGMSNGGFMALTLACRRPDKVAAVVSVTGGVAVNLPPACPDGRAVPVALVLGDQDPLVPWAGGDVARDNGRVLSAKEGAAFFARRAGCAAPVTQALPDVDPADGTRVVLDVHAGCRDGAEVRLYTVQGGGHTWPGGWAYMRERFIGKTSNDLDASLEAWRFFQRFRLPQGPQSGVE